MAPKIVPLTAERHGNMSWRRFLSYSFARQSQFAPLAAVELERAIQTLPVCFIQHEGRFFLTALLSLVPGDNFFVDNEGRWQCGYVPASLRCHPFLLARFKRDEEPVICIDEECELICEQDGGEALFGKEGDFSAPVAEVAQFVHKVAHNNQKTQEAVDALAKAGLIGEWPLAFKAGDEERRVAGLYHFYPNRLPELDDQIFLGLRQTEALRVGFGQLFSMGNCNKLLKLARMRAQKKEEPAQSAELSRPEDSDFKRLFDNDGLLCFDSD